MYLPFAPFFSFCLCDVLCYPSPFLHQGKGAWRGELLLHFPHSPSPKFPSSGCSHRGVEFVLRRHTSHLPSWANTAFWRLEQQQEQQQQLDDEDVDNGNAASCDEVPRVVIGSDPREYVGLAEVYSALMVHGGKRQGAWLLTRSRRAEESSEEDPIKNREIVKADGNDGQLRTANIITPCPLIVDADDSSIFQIALDPVGIPTVLDGLVYVHRYTVYNLTGTEKNKL
eukprot:GHVT01074019.1.p1 GENE.GHVT01074019.1~~GHVT01074019.1.p1  ORF type:complete len:227 (+),score=36.07 GHVT01074019.1:258-938(+)